LSLIKADDDEDDSSQRKFGFEFGKTDRVLQRRGIEELVDSLFKNQNAVWFN
jgi:hypothetical protein